MNSVFTGYIFKVLYVAHNFCLVGSHQVAPPALGGLEGSVRLVLTKTDRNHSVALSISMPQYLVRTLSNPE